MPKRSVGAARLSRQAQALLVIAGLVLVSAAAAAVLLTSNPAYFAKLGRALSGGSVFEGGVTYHYLAPVKKAPVNQTCLSGSSSLNTQMLRCASYLWDSPESNRNQMWYLEDMGGGYSRLRIRTSSFCLDAEGDNPGSGSTVIAFGCKDTNNDNQLWKTVTPGSNFQLENKKTGLCAVVKDGSTAEGALVILEDCKAAQTNGRGGWQSW